MMVAEQSTPENASLSRAYPGVILLCLLVFSGLVGYRVYRQYTYRSAQEAWLDTAPQARKLDLNTASVAELCALPGIGPVSARAIVDWRRGHGQFESLEELDKVHGFGPKRVLMLAAWVKVEGRR